MQVEQQFFIGAQDVGARNQVKNKALLEMLSNTAILHAERAGHGFMTGATPDLYAARPAVWVVLHWKLEVTRRAKLCEVLTARTWAEHFDRLRAFRDFDLLDKDGRTVGRATSDWTALDPAKGSLIRLTEEWMAGYECEPGHQAFPRYIFPREKALTTTPDRSCFFTVNRSMIDYNRHVHNTAYLDLADEVRPEGLEEADVDSVEITYKKEARLGDRLLLEYRKVDPAPGNIPAEHLVYVKSEDGKVLHASMRLY